MTQCHISCFRLLLHHQRRQKIQLAPMLQRSNYPMLHFYKPSNPYISDHIYSKFNSCNLHIMHHLSVCAHVARRPWWDRTWLIIHCMTRKLNEVCISIKASCPQYPSLPAITFKPAHLNNLLRPFAITPTTNIPALSTPMKSQSWVNFIFDDIPLITFSSVDWPWRIRNYWLWRICQDHDLTVIWRMINILKDMNVNLW